MSCSSVPRSSIVSLNCWTLVFSLNLLTTGKIFSNTNSSPCVLTLRHVDTLSSPCPRPSHVCLSVCPCRPEAAEVGGSARRLDPRPRRQDSAQEEGGVQEEEDVRPSEDGRQDVREQEEEEVAAGVWLADGLSPVWTPRFRGLSPGCRRRPPTRWTCSKLGGNRRVSRWETNTDVWFFSSLWDEMRHEEEACLIFL